MIKYWKFSLWVWKPGKDAELSLFNTVLEVLVSEFDRKKIGIERKKINQAI